MNFRQILVLLALFIAPHLFSQTLETLQGQQIKPFVEQITNLSLEVYREAPYLYEGSLEEYGPFIGYYSESAQGIASLVFVHDTLVGVAIGMPMVEMREKYLQPYAMKRPGENLSEVFYLGEFLLLKEYRGKGWGKEMFSSFEAKAQEQNFKKICLCSITESHLNCDYQDNSSTDRFWEKLGFTKCEDITFSVAWKNVGTEENHPHQMVYWFKAL